MEYYPMYNGSDVLSGIRDERGHTMPLARLDTYLAEMGKTRSEWLAEHPWVASRKTRKEEILEKSSFTNADRDELLRILAGE